MSRRLWSALLILLVFTACEPSADLVEPQPQRPVWIRHAAPEQGFSIATPLGWRRDLSPKRAKRLFLTAPDGSVFSGRMVEGKPPNRGDEAWLAWLVETDGLVGIDLGWVETPAGRVRHAAEADLLDVYYALNRDGQVVLFSFMDPAFRGLDLDFNRRVMETLEFDPVN